MKDEYWDDYDFIHNKGCEAINGDAKEKKQFIEQFYARYESYIRGILAKRFRLYNEEQNEVFADFLISIWNNENNRLSDYRGDSSFKTYIYSVLRYFVLDWKSRENEYTYHHIKASELTNKYHDYNEEPSHNAVFDFLQRMRTPDTYETPLSPEELERLDGIIQNAMAQALLQLSFFYPEGAQILVMDLCDIDHKEMARRLGIKENTLNQRISRTPYGIRERFGIMFKEILCKHYDLDIDMVAENFLDICR